ncbi:unnamed protein product [Pleuronectes platessa]|uniref:Uncharacterized protein n=1 Tax=Pleuronectes platessa TaxID=8262 RepID=A0A9N7TYK3_PLEPL|nr:unnamed protein product [Pleuronectes platessa]
MKVGVPPPLQRLRQLPARGAVDERRTNRMKTESPDEAFDPRAPPPSSSSQPRGNGSTSCSHGKNLVVVGTCRLNVWQRRLINESSSSAGFRISSSGLRAAPVINPPGVWNMTPDDVQSVRREPMASVNEQQGVSVAFNVSRWNQDKMCRHVWIRNHQSAPLTGSSASSPNSPHNNTSGRLGSDGASFTLSGSGTSANKKKKKGRGRRSAT